MKDDILLKEKKELTDLINSTNKPLNYIEESRIIQGDTLKSSSYDMRVFSGKLDEKIEISIKSFSVAKILILLKQNFLKEITVSQMTTHQRVPRLYGYSYSECYIRLIYDQIKGESLRKKYPNSDDLTKLDYLYQSIEIISDLNNQGIYHKNLRTSKFIITSDNKVFLKDLSQIGYEVGTLRPEEPNSTAYLPPESTDEVDDENDNNKGDISKYDVWSLCCIISEVMTGVAPWSNIITTSKPATEKLMLISLMLKKTKYPIPDNCPTQLLEILKQGFELEPSNRITVDNLKSQFKQFISDFKI